MRRLLKVQPKRYNALFARSKDEWQSIKSFPYNPMDEHEEPSQDEMVREIFDKEYYKFGFRAMTDKHLHDNLDKFNQFRQWQHLYATPKDPVLGWTHGSVFFKYLWLALPAAIFFYYFKVFTVWKNIYYTIYNILYMINLIIYFQIYLEY